MSWQLFNPIAMYKKHRLLFLIIISITLISCSSYKNDLLSSGNQDQVVLNAIIDFSNTNISYKKHSVFHVTFYDTLYRKVLKKESENNYSWVNGKPYNNIIAISILGSDDKHVYKITQKNGIGIKGFLPSKYIEKNGKLFIWYDDNIPLDEKTLSILKKYELIDTEELASITIDDTKKGADYYFCRNNLKKYKKKLSSIAIGYYDAPEIDCD